MTRKERNEAVKLCEHKGCNNMAAHRGYIHDPVKDPNGYAVARYRKTDRCDNHKRDIVLPEDYGK